MGNKEMSGFTLFAKEIRVKSIYYPYYPVILMMILN